MSEVFCRGFPREGFDFLRDLAENNNKPWFEANRRAATTMGCWDPGSALRQRDGHGTVGVRARDFMPSRE